MVRDFPGFEQPQNHDLDGLVGPLPQEALGPYLERRDGKLFTPKLFPLAVQCPGALHILHHAVEELTSAFEAYDPWFLPGLRAVVRVFGQKPVRERFVAEVLRESEASSFETAVLELQLNLHEARWGTLVSTCKALLGVRLVFAYWNLDKVVGAAPQPHAPEDARDTYASATLMTECVRSHRFWCYTNMLVRLSRVIDRLENWCEACPCHYKSPPDSLPLSSNAIFRTRSACPLAGRRAPELAAGALDTLIQECFKTQHAELLVTCASLPRDEADSVLQDFARGQAKLEHFLMLKFAFWKALPHSLCALGHHSEATAREALTRARQVYDEHLESPNHHALTKHFFAGALSEQVKAFISGEISREQSPALMQEAAACQFVSCVERSIEARHALLKAKTAVMKRITPATFSIAIRSHEFHRRCLKDLAMLSEWESQVKRLKTRPRKGLPHVLVHLGMSHHPDVVRLQCQQHEIKLKDAACVIYRCDLLTQYDKRVAAGKQLKHPDFRNNPDAADKLRRLVDRESTEEGKRRVMLRILMLEHFRRTCQEGELYSLQGHAPDPRYVQASLLPQGVLTQACQRETVVPETVASFMAADPEPSAFEVREEVSGNAESALAVLGPQDPVLFVQVRGLLDFAVSVRAVSCSWFMPASVAAGVCVSALLARW